MMSKYQELHDKYELAKRAEISYWINLQKQIMQIRKGFAEYLNLPETKVKFKGEDIPRLAVGFIERDGFGRVITGEEFTKSDRNLNFSLRFSIDESDKKAPDIPPNVIVYLLSISTCPSGYKVIDLAENEEITFEDSAEPLFDYLYAEAQRKIG